ncbi:MAG: MFS transporter [Gemmatimonadetes bacterium]|mgnify:FL=1|nr:MFS transporter [Gemmatimonadota bacterium]
MSQQADQRARKKLHKNVWVATATSFLTDVSSEMLVNVLPLFLANVLGVRIWTVGVIYGLGDTAASVLKLYSGWLSDRLRARKWLAVAGYTTSALSRPFLYFASTWGAVAAIRFADRVGKGIRTAPRDALLADSTPPERRGLAFGLHRAGDSAGAVIGLLLTIWVVANTQGANARLSEETFRTLVLWSLLPAFLAIVVLAMGARDVAIHGDGAPTGPHIRIRGLGKGFAAFAACSVVFELGNSADAFLILRAQERGLSVVGVLWILVGFNVVYTAISAPAGSLADRVPRKWVLFSGWLVYAAVYLGFAAARTPTHVAVLYAVYGAYHGLVSGAAKALIADLVPAELRGTAYGSYAALVGLISLPASLLAGVLWQGVGPWGGLGAAAPFAFGAATAGLAAVLLVWTVPDGRAQSSLRAGS